MVITSDDDSLGSGDSQSGSEDDSDTGKASRQGVPVRRSVPTSVASGSNHAFCFIVNPMSLENLAQGRVYFVPVNTFLL